MFRKMPVIFLAIISFFILADAWIPLALKQGIFALSLSLKSLIIFTLPFLIFMLIFKTLAELAKEGGKMVAYIMGALCLSNLLTTLISYQVGGLLYHLDFSLSVPEQTKGLIPLWDFTIPKLISNDKAMLAGMLFGILASFLERKKLTYVLSFFDLGVKVLLKGLSRAVPLFVFGFLVKIIHEKMLKSIFVSYSFIFTLVTACALSYIILMYLFANHFHLKNTLSSMRNMAAAAFSGFSSMSSAAALPLSMVGVEKNLNNKTLARLAPALTANTHLLGDCFAIPIFAFAVMKNFGLSEPTFAAYFIFALYFVMAKFSVAAIPGGGMIVMLPILESHLGFTSEMSLLITALYMMFDPIASGANVFGNGAFSQLLERGWNGFAKHKRVG